MSISEVSIPLRYADNHTAIRGIMYIVQFQFLLGTLITYSPLLLALPSGGFNSS